jgi:hypothetical protein
VEIGSLILDLLPIPPLLAGLGQAQMSLGG